jgi:putative acetyltransferase
LIAAIRASPNYVPELALVAEPASEDSASERAVVGHLMISLLDLVTDAGGLIPILVLSPVGVHPEVQNQGIGGILTRAALAVADERPEPLMIVQGHPDYYPRFGFVRGRSIGVMPPEHLGGIDRAWMARRRPGAPPVEGRVTYPRYFIDLD